MSQETLYQQAAKALETGDMRAAILACREINARYPDFQDGWRIAYDLHMRMGKPKSALVAIDRVLSFPSAVINDTFKKAESLLGLDLKQQALELLNQLATDISDEAIYHDHLALLFSRLEQHQQALYYYQKALRLEPDNAVLLYNIASEQRFLGDMLASEQSLNQSLAIDPYDYEALAMRSSLRKQTADDNHIEELKNRLEGADEAGQGIPHICYALAKELEDLQQYDTAFEFLQRGASQRRRQMNYRVETDVQIMTKVREVFTQQLLQSEHSACASEEPIFIIGLPRTGTTLVERILGSHSRVFAAGELDSFARQMMAQINVICGANKPASRDRVVETSALLDFSQLGADYIMSTRPLTGNTAHFIDKLPFNFLYAGLIHLALPKAKIINLHRHPMAACYAIYRQLFRDAYPFSYSFEDLASYYIAYDQLMAHWHQVMPNVVYTIAYEDVVNDTEHEAKRLVQHCDLRWEPQCLEFYKSSQASTTASAAQIRQPVYSSSVDKWRHYERQLQPLRQLLVNGGIAVPD